MKRVVIRISALIGIVALGLIAIAQAQRGVGTTSQAADPSTVAAPASDGTIAASASTVPTFEALAGAEPQALPTGLRANPLRGGSQSDTSQGVRATGLSTESESSDSAAVRHVADPFGPATASAQQQPNSAEPSTASLTGPALPVGQTLQVSNTPPLALVGDSQAAASAGSSPVALAPSTEPMPKQPAAAAAGDAGQPSATAGPAVGTPQPVFSDPDKLPATTAAASAYTSPPAVTEAAPPAPAGQPNLMGPGVENATPIAASPAVASAGQGTGTPGDARLEGPQAPQLTIQKSAPAEIQVGKAAKFQIAVRNTGATVAQNVEIRDDVPRGAQLIGTTPPASRGVRGELVWSLGELKPGQEATVQVEVMPVAEGEIGSVATVSFNATASAKSIATKPELAIQTTAPRQVLIGQEVALSITISNPGSGVANDVILEERVPPGLQHAAGAELQYEVGTLKPHESKQIELRMVATQAGTISNVLTARGANNLQTENNVQFEVLAPKLEVAMDGPKRRYLEREAVYTVMISNPGTAPAHQVELVAQLPAGLNFVSANNSGSYDQNTKTVHWLLEELPPSETGSVQLTAMPVVAGEQTIRVKGSAEQGLQSEKEHSILVEGIAAILFEVVDVADPIEVNGETTYEIRVVNQGSKAATNVRVQADLPPGMRPVAAEGPTTQSIAGNRVAFEPLARLAPKADTTYRIRVQGVQPGDQRIRVQLQTDELKTPVTKEESTRVYSDG